MDNKSKVKLVALPMLSLYHNGNYIKSFKSAADLDKYLREIHQWQSPNPDEYLKKEINMDGRWSVVRSEFLKYEDV